MKTKRIITLAVAAVLTLAMLAGCGAAAPAAEPTAAPATDAPATEAPASEAPAALSGSAGSEYGTIEQAALLTDGTIIHRTCTVSAGAKNWSAWA